VTLKNLNYGKVSSSHGDEVGVDNGDDIGIDNGDDNSAENNIDKILNAISDEPKATQKRLSEITGLSTRTISREIKELREAGVINRVGSDRVGYWDIVKHKI
jgi:predicted HTH transcriptional regulator